LNERGTVELRVVSPCEHGVEHHAKELPMGVLNFSVPECRDTKGNPRNHIVTPEKYPETVRRR
jgi:hypothetical protein